MSNLVHVRIPDGKSLKDVLFERGVEFPCGGVSLCGHCKVRVVEGTVPITQEMEWALEPAELAKGWRLGCLAEAHGEVTVEVGQWETPILADNSVVAFEPGQGRGAVVDIGTTTVVAQLLDLANGEVLEVRTSLNPQCVHGADLMSRIDFDLREPGVLKGLIRCAVGEMLAGWEVREVLLAGNTAMHHFFCGFDVEPLSHVPFETETPGACEFTAEELHWTNPAARIEFLPCLGGFVGSDVLAGMIAVRMLESDRVLALVDLGTNGEIAIGNCQGVTCASTAAGPAFEAGRIRMGMRAATGAISSVEVHANALKCSVIGGGEPRGICGSGLVDAVAAALELGMVRVGGRFVNGSRELALSGDVTLAQSDIRELQLAKGAIAAGLRLLGADRADHLYLAGAFGNYVSVASARRIGLLPAIPENVVPSGNTALQGTKVLLLNPSRRAALLDAALSRTAHVSLGSLPDFQDTYVDCMVFPE
jgi:uncharacterized 2Fe-2S/4Fe-4S cluster protein (DUF4445 family)